MILKNWSNQAANAIQTKYLFFFCFPSEGIVKTGRNTFYKYEYEYKVCLPYMLQTGFCKS